MPTVTPETKTFPTAAAWESWLSKHLDTHEGIWLQIAKKASGLPSVTYDEALDTALCYGWIDGLKRSLDEKYFLQKFTPRRQRSIWSKRNVEKVLHLIKAGKMKPSGQAEVDRAQADGRWQAAYDSPKNMVIPDDFKQAVQKNRKAQATFAKLNKSSLFAIAWRLQTAKKPETRVRRFNVFIEKLEKGEAI